MMVTGRFTSLWLTCFAVWSVAMLADANEEVLARHARATMSMMLDMRGTPDIRGECDGARYIRNSTDCTQFYRCVDFVRNGEHTIFRFMCGAGTVFDESQALCTGAEMADPPCPSDQLYKIAPAPVEPVIAVRPVTPVKPAVAVTPVISVTPARPTIPASPNRPAIPAGIPKGFGQRLTGFVTFADEDLDVGASSTYEDVIVPKDTFYGFIARESGAKITIFEEGSLTGGFEITIVEGAMLAFYTTQEGSIITNVKDGIFSTSSTTITLAPGTSIMILNVDSTGLFYIEEVVMVTTTISQVTLHTHFTMGILLFTTEMRLISIGGRSFTTQYMITETTTIISYGVIHTETRTYGSLVITSTFEWSGATSRLSGIIPVGSSDVKFDKLTMKKDDLFAIIPTRGQGSMSLKYKDGKTTALEILPGYILTIKLAGSSVVQYLSGGYFTTERTVLSFPAGSIISIMEVGIDGHLIVTKSIETTTSFIVNVEHGSFVSTMTVSATGLITSFRESHFTIQKMITGASTTSVAYFGLIHLSGRKADVIKEDVRIAVITETRVTPATPVIPAIPATPIVAAIPAKRPKPTKGAIGKAPAGTIPKHFGESLTGFITFEDDEKREEFTNLDVTLEEDSFFGFISESVTEFTVLEQGSTTGGFKITIESGSMLAMLTDEDGSKITNLRNGLFSTSTTTMSLAPGTTFMLLTVDSTGLFYIKRVLLVTKTISQVSMPVHVFMGPILFTPELRILSLAGRSFSTQYISYEISTQPGSFTFRSFGIFHGERINAANVIIRTTEHFSNSQQVAGLLPLGSAEYAPEMGSISLVSDDLFAMIPSTGRGIVEIKFADSTENYLVTPGSMFTVRLSGAALMKFIARGFYTTDRSVLSFPAGSVISMMKMSIDGALTAESTIQTTSAFTVKVAAQSMVGVLRMTSAGILTAFGEAPFVTQRIFSASSQSVAYFGLIGLSFRHTPVVTATVTSTSTGLPVGQVKITKTTQTTTVVKKPTVTDVLKVGSQIIGKPKVTITQTTTPVVTVTKTAPVVTVTKTRTPVVTVTKTRTPVVTVTKTRTPVVTVTKTTTPIVTVKQTKPVVTVTTSKVQLPVQVTGSRRVVTVQKTEPTKVVTVNGAGAIGAKFGGNVGGGISSFGRFRSAKA